MAQIIDGHKASDIVLWWQVCVTMLRSWQRGNKMQNLKPLCDGAPITAESSFLVQSHAAST